MTVKIIAELCQNHLGDRERLMDMVDAAAASGATHIKMQHIHVRNLTYRPQFEEGLSDGAHTRAIKRPFGPEYDRLKGLELDPDDAAAFVERVRARGAVPLTTCFARADAHAIREQGFRSVKVASYDCASYQMLRELAGAFDEIIVSTGATYDDEIAMAAEILAGSAALTMLHCVTLYPTALQDMNLARMLWLKRFAPSVGLSDHSLVGRDGLLASKAALALGAEAIERHFTILEPGATKDGLVSVSPEQLAELRRFALLARDEQEAEMTSAWPEWRDVIVGAASRTLTDDELLNRDYYRGRFASPRVAGRHEAGRMVFNWEETPV